MYASARALTLFAFTASFHSGAAQTFVVGRELVGANADNLEPAQELIAGRTGVSAYQLTDAVLSNLKSLQLSNASNFDFGPSGKSFSGSECKVYPGDAAWPTSDTWNSLDLLTGGALIKTVPLGAACFAGDHYDAAACNNLLESWADAELHAADPTSTMNPLFDGATCQPQDAAKGGTCELGGLPTYSVKATTVAQIQLAVNFARNNGLRLVVHNTGHDYVGKSAGAGALSIWTHNIKGIDFIPNYSSDATDCNGPALKLGAGVQAFELYDAANKHGVTAQGGMCHTVGIAGGYYAGGGHNPLMSKYGLAADNVLSFDLVTPDGRFITADQKQNPDLYWALRGGGGGTFGVVTQVTVKVFPKMTITGMKLNITGGGTEGQVSEDVFWAGLTAYWRHFPEFADAGSWAFNTIFPTPDGGFVWNVEPWVIPEISLEEFQALTADLMSEWQTIGFNVKPTYFSHDNYLDAYKSHFAGEQVGLPNVRTASRLIPKENWVNPSLLNDTVSFIQRVIRDGSSLISYNLNGAAPAGAPPAAIVPAWREAYMFAIVGSLWDTSLPEPEVEAVNRRITEDWTASLRSLTPGGGTYLNEPDVMDPDWQKAFYGYDGYNRLRAIKEQVDPWGLMYAPTGVGSEDWVVEGQTGYVTKQTGRLCRK